MEIEQATTSIDLLIGFNVTLYVGEKVFKGKLIGVKNDHIILENDNNNNIFYYSLDQIQAIARNTKEFQGQEATADYFQTQSLIDLLHSLKNTWVTILCLNKQKFSGVLIQVDNNFATLISGEERNFINLSHISNVFKGFLKENNNVNESKNQDLNHEKKKEEHIEIRMNEKTEPVKEAIQETNRLEESSIKVVSSDPAKDSKVWSHSIKNVKEKLNGDTTQKLNMKMKKSREDEFQTSKREKESKKMVVKSPEKEAKQNTKEVNITKDVKDTNKQEPIIKGKDIVQPTSSTPPPTVEQIIPQAKNEEEKRKEDSIRAFRFLGEPANLREIDRTVFSGWPVPRNRPRI